MAKAHFFDTNQMVWQKHSQFQDIRFKALETRETHPSARFTLVELEAGGLIETHVHEVEIETVYILAGQGLLTLVDEESLIEAGMGVSIPMGLQHSLRNSGDIPLEILAVHVQV